MKPSVLFAVLTSLVLVQTAQAAETVSAKVVRVTSGDTMVVAIDGREKTVALAGIVAPSDGLSERAKKNLAAKVADQTVKIQFLPAAEGVDAALAAVWLDDRSINTEMVREGWARYDTRYPTYKKLAKAEAEARRAKRGLWGMAAPSSATGSYEKQESQELRKDDGRAKGKKSFPRGMAVKFEAPAEGKWNLTAVRIHGSRYGHPTPPREKFHVTLCDLDYKPIADFAIPYSKFKRTQFQKWVTLKVKPTEVPEEFIICVNFNAEATKGVFVSHDAEGIALVAKPNKPSGTFSGGDWLIRAVVERR